MRANKPGTKILVDGGDPDQTLQIKKLIGFVDGQTTNPSLIAKNPEVQQLLASGHRLNTEEQKGEYKKIVQRISPLVGTAGVSIEVFADLDTTAEQMVAQGQEMFSWIPNAYIKYPCTHEGLRAAHVSVEQGIRVNNDIVLLARSSCGCICGNKGLEGASLRLAIYWQARRHWPEWNGCSQKHFENVSGRRSSRARVGCQHTTS